MSNKVIIILIFLIILFIIYKYNIETYSTIVDNDFINFIDKNKFYDEKNNLIDHKKEEIDEQHQAFKFIDPSDIVLELGGRYGTVSTVINKKINDKKSHVVVEPDSNVIPSLEKNKTANNCEFVIFPKFISNSNKKIIYDGYATRIEDSNDKSDSQMSYLEFKKIFPQQFNVLVADCEGCLFEFLEMMNDDFNLLNKVIYEADQPHICDYNKVKEKLLNAGFRLVDDKDNFRFVYMK